MKLSLSFKASAAVAAGIICMAAIQPAQAAITYSNGDTISSSVDPDAVFSSPAGGNVTFEPFVQAGNITYTSTAGSFTATSNGGVVDISGAISNQSANTQSIVTDGILSFTGTTFSGGAVALGVSSGGAVTFTGVGAAGNLSVSSAGSVDVSNSTGLSLGAVSQNTGADLGVSTATLGTSSLSLNGNNTFEFNLGSGADGRVNVAGLLGYTLGAVTTINVSTNFALAQGTYTLIDFGSKDLALTSAAFLLNFSQAGYIGTLAVTPDSLANPNGPGEVQLVLTAVPEVSSAWLPLVGVAGLLAYRRRSAAAVVA